MPMPDSIVLDPHKMLADMDLTERWLGEIRGRKYSVIYADPPWNFLTRSAKGRDRCPDGRGHYEVMPIEDIKALPVARLAAKRCALFLWVTDPMLPQCIAVGEAWGFEFATVAFTWAKRTVKGKWHFGNGYYTRANPEMCLLFTTERAPERK